jgi:hypothetical protein
MNHGINYQLINSQGITQCKVNYHKIYIYIYIYMKLQINSNEQCLNISKFTEIPINMNNNDMIFFSSGYALFGSLKLFN